MQHTQNTGPNGGDTVERASHTAANASNSTAEYVREILKNNPGPALLTAAVLGFLVARSLSRD